MGYLPKSYRQRPKQYINTLIMTHIQTTLKDENITKTVLPAIFHVDAEGYNPLYRPVNDLKGQNGYLFLEVDTEYQHYENIAIPPEITCQDITYQCRAIALPEGFIFNPPNFKGRHKSMTSEWVVVDYLNHLGFKTEIVINPEPPYPDNFLQISLFAYYGIVELTRIFKGTLLDIILGYCRNTKGNQIKQGRRLLTCSNQGGHYQDYVTLPCQIVINGYPYNLRLSIFDTSAIHGNGNYKSFCKTSGVKLPYKDNFTDDEKSRMLEMYHERPEDFDNYALGDLHNHDALMGNQEKFKAIYKALRLAKYFTPPRLTIGSTVAKLIESGIKKHCRISPDDHKFIKQFCHPGSADKIKRRDDTGCYNAKVDGGRCRNNRPLDTYIKTAICDIDIDGCYGNGLRCQTYPLGNPVILSYPRGSKINKLATLGEFLAKYESELVPGLWQVRVTVKQCYTLKYEQDYFVSWIPPQNPNNIPTDTDIEATDQWFEVENYGLTKVFKYDVQTAIITHDGLQWIRNICSPRQRNELLKNLVVDTAMFYPKSDRVDTVQELIKSHANHNGKNTCEITSVGDLTTITKKEQECYKWLGIGLDKLLIDSLLSERKKYPKGTDFNKLYKLCVNTIYGDMVSPYFDVGNVVVGNNITARARAMAWCMEKGFNSFQSITDGGCFDLNRVISKKDDKHRINGNNSVDISSKVRLQNLKARPLQFGDRPVVKYQLSSGQEVLVTVENNGENEVITYEKDDLLPLLNEASLKHLQDNFPGLDVLQRETVNLAGKPQKGQFTLEIKDLFSEGCFHGAGNYLLIDGDGERKLAMRSYKKKGVARYSFGDELTLEDKDYRPALEFMLSLLVREVINRSKPFVKSRILKLGDYNNNYNSWKETRCLPGMSVQQSGLLREFSLSQFLFNNHEQYLSWEQEKARLLRKYGQSYEMFFTDENGDLNYQAMVIAVHKKISKGEMKFGNTGKRKNCNMSRYQSAHPSLENLEFLKKKIDEYHRGNPSG